MTRALRSLNSLCCIIAFGTCVAQCGPFRYHPLWPSTLGAANIHLDECTDATGVLWDNGATTVDVDSLSVGPHTVTFFNGADPIQTIPFTIEQQYWDLHQSVHTMTGAIEVSIAAAIDRCTPQIFDGLVCPPDPAQTVVRLLQDGIVIDSLTPVDCIYTTHFWPGLPFGHTYSTEVLSTGNCITHGQGPVVTAYDCSGVAIDPQAAYEQTSGTGSITVAGIDPGPPGPFSPPSPIAGTFMLVDADMNVIGDAAGSSAEWSGLALGSYTVIFANENLCSPVVANVVLDVSSGIGYHTIAPRALWPVPVSNTLHWSGSGTHRIMILDMVGRAVLRSSGSDHIDVASLAPGNYLLQLDSDPPRRFLKR